jgi:WD40-like Beta Propeller Repeat
VKRLLLRTAVASAAALAGATWLAAANTAPEPVRIASYTGEAMEPFVSRDGKFLFFNTRNDPGTDTNLHFAEVAFDGHFRYLGLLEGTKSTDLDAVATMSADGQFCFISPREYRRTLISVFCGKFDGTKVVDATPQAGLATARLGRLIFDMEIGTDGRTMIYAEGSFSGKATPDDADLYLAKQGPNGFEPDPNGKRILARLNTDALEYAPALSANGLSLTFTRLEGIWPFQTPSLFRASRKHTGQAFDSPVRLTAIDGFVEGATYGPDGALYYHKRVNGRFQIWRLPR